MVQIDKAILRLAHLYKLKSEDKVEEGKEKFIGGVGFKRVWRLSTE